MRLHDLVRRNEFRQDLLYRINTVEIHVPPHRDRQEDIPLLANHFTSIFAKKYKKQIDQINPAAMKKLEKYHWPGNIRELRHAIERAVILTETNTLQPSDFLFPETEKHEDELQFDSFDLDHVEKTVIRKALAKHSGNLSHAAHELGITRASLYRRMEKYGL